MVNYGTILYCPLGDQKDLPALRRLGTLIDHFSSHLTLLGVVPTPGRIARYVYELEDLVEQAVEHERSRLSRWEAELGRSRTQVVVDKGSAAPVILDHVERDGHELVVLTSDGDRENRTTTKRLLRTCPAPVWVMRPSRARKLRFLAAVNLGDDERELNLRILDHAATMQRIFGGELHVVHAWELYGEAALRQSAFVRMPDDEVHRLIAAEAKIRAQGLADLLAEPALADAPWQSHLAYGSPVDAVLGLIEKKKINNLVLGTVARAGVAGFLIGNTAESILDAVDCSVIALKPPDF